MISDKKNKTKQTMHIDHQDIIIEHLYVYHKSLPVTQTHKIISKFLHVAVTISH